MFRSLASLSPLLLLSCVLDVKDLLDTGTSEQDTSEEEEGDFHWPSKEGYVDPGFPGWQGRTQISTTEGCWEDTDGVAPGVAGCHTLRDGDESCTECQTDVLERIGEACYLFTRTEGGETEEKLWLVETNPEANKCHPHVDGKGHPDVYDCEEYCQGTLNESGANYTGGSCVEVAELDCVGTPQASAECACTD